MRGVDIDPATGTARAEADAVWQDVIVPAAEHGLAGSPPGVGVAGYTLGDGLGFLGRPYGLAANSVTAAELVTPGGDLVRADADHEPALTSRLAGGQDQPSPGWLGHHAIPAQIRQSGLWNVEHVTQSCRPGFLATLYQLIQLHQ